MASSNNQNRIPDSSTSIFRNINVHFGGEFKYHDTYYDGGQVAPFRAVNVTGFDLPTLLHWVQQKISVPVSDILYRTNAEGKAKWLESDDDWFTCRSESVYLNLYAVYRIHMYRDIKIHYGGEFLYNRTVYRGGQAVLYRDVEVGRFDYHSFKNWVIQNTPGDAVTDILYFTPDGSQSKWLVSEDDWLVLREYSNIHLYPFFLDWDAVEGLNYDSGSDNSQDIRPFD